MFKKMSNALSKPRFAFFAINESGVKIFTYILMLTLIMSFTTLLNVIVKSEKLFVGKEKLNNEIALFVDKNIVIENYQFNNNNVNEYFIVDDYIFVIGNVNVNEIGYVIHFKEDKIETNFKVNERMILTLDEISYQQLKIENLQFTKENSSRVINLIYSVLKNNRVLVLSILFASYFENIIKLLFVILFFTFLSIFFKNLPIKFKDHFKVNTYLATIYAFTTLILKLFDLESLNLLSLLLVSLYHSLLYRTIRLIPKERKDNDE